MRQLWEQDGRFRVDMTEDFDIGDLEGVGPVTKKKLIESGVNNIMDIVVRGPVELEEITGLNTETCKKIVETSRKYLSDTGAITKEFRTGAEILNARKKDIEIISTSSEALDELLQGGVETKAVTEVYGEYGSGKTQLCHTLCVTVQKPKDQGGLDGSVLYIDTEGTFRPERVVDIATVHGLDTEKILDRIIVARAYNTDHQMLILEQAGKLISEEGIKLIISDSATGLFRAEHLGRGTLAARQQKLSRYMRLLNKLAEVYNCAVVVTNQVLTAADAAMFGDPTRPVGGNILGHASTYRMYFRKAAKTKRVVKMVDSPHHPLSEVAVELGLAGIIDTEEYLERKAKEKAKEEAREARKR